MTSLCPPTVCENGSFEPLMHKCDLCTKTGSGQTGKTQKILLVPFSQVPTNPLSIACTPPTTNESKFAAYRLHVAGDPLLFEGGAVQTWRNGDVRGCPWPGGGAPPKGDAPVVNASSLALLYEWS